jgi:trk system potassium uptake protein TrkA
VKAIVIGCGRVGSQVAKNLDAEGWDVAAIDENEEVLNRLGETWSGGFIVGHAMDLDVLRRAGIEDADAVVIATNGDNTNLVVAQLAQRQFEVPFVIVRILDPARAELYEGLGLQIICPTRTATETLTNRVLESAARTREEAKA